MTYNLPSVRNIHRSIKCDYKPSLSVNSDKLGNFFANDMTGKNIPIKNVSDHIFVACIGVCCVTFENVMRFK